MKQTKIKTLGHLPLSIASLFFLHSIIKSNIKNQQLRNRKYSKISFCEYFYKNKN